MERRQIYLTEEQDALLRGLSEQRGSSVAELVREAIDHLYRSGHSFGALRRRGALQAAFKGRSSGRGRRRPRWQVPEDSGVVD